MLASIQPKSSQRSSTFPLSVSLWRPLDVLDTPVCFEEKTNFAGCNFLLDVEMGFHTHAKKRCSEFHTIDGILNIGHSSVVFDDYQFDVTVYTRLIYVAHDFIVHTPSELMPAGFVLTRSRCCLSASRVPYIMNLIDSFCPP